MVKKTFQCSIVQSNSRRRLTSEDRPSPTPSQAERCKRVCVHANVQGIALRLSMPPLGLRFAGRLPILRLPSSSSGVAWRKYGTKRGSSRTSWR
mmetsp:Transcript_27911/g.41154  ORF Transcript_27911/g.41154 Transcript_27911/m.41154 type:complete len:94 (-) Transcript_27911:2371-2652(-)